MNRARGPVGLAVALAVLALGPNSAAGSEPPLSESAERDFEARAPERWTPQAATHLGGRFGLTGFGTMIDGRIPSPFLTNPGEETPLGTWSTRVSLRYDLLLSTRELRGATRRYRVREARESLRASYALSVRGLDLSLGLPYRRETTRVGAPGNSEGTLRAEGVGPLSVGAKVAFRIPEFFFGDWAVAALAPYVLAQVPSGAERLDDPGWVEAGVALAGPYGFGFRWIGNFALRQHEGGLSAAIYRFGASGVPLADASKTLRIYAHVAGVEYEGHPNSDVDLEAGGQLLLGGLVTLDLGLSWRLVDSGYVSPRLRGALADRFGEAPRGWHADQAFTLTFAVGFVL